MRKGKLIHCMGVVPCREPDEPGYRYQDWGNQEFRNEFLRDFNLDYILNIALKNKIHFHITTHSEATKTCEEKAKITGLPLNRVIKGYYLQDNTEENVYGLMIPGNSTYNKRKVAVFLNIDIAEAETRISRSNWLPGHMKYGTVHPFVNRRSFNSHEGDGKLEAIIFDKKTLEQKGLSDFSFTTHQSTGLDDYRTSIQMSCKDAYAILTTAFPNRIHAADII